MSSNSSPGIGLPTILGVTFIVLKLTGVINWSWLWVLAPFWIGFILWLFFMGLLILLLAIFSDEPKRRTYRTIGRTSSPTRRRRTP